MKNVYKLFVAGICATMLVSCGDSFLTRDPYGRTITQGQYEKLANQLEGSMRGIYSMMYAVSDHDAFGKRSIDMYTDLMCGDMALTNYSYGWFYTDEQGEGRTGRTGYIWYYYYSMLHNVNAVIYTAQGGSTASADNVIKRIAANGLPNVVNTKGDEVMYYTTRSTTIDTIIGGADTTIIKVDTLATFNESESVVANCYAQALTMRGYIYSNLLMLYCETPKKVSDIDKELAFPLYNEINMNEAQGLATMGEVYAQVESDLTNAIDYFSAFSEVQRPSKLVVDKSIACAILAYSYLNKGKSDRPGEAYTQAYTNARDFAQLAITTTTAQILPRNELLETGFNNVNNVSWMWGQDVTVETAGGLASFFGQVDIHSYSYAWAGDTKVIDENLYKEIPDYDARKRWFNDGSTNSTYKLCPDGKFFSAANPKSTKTDDIDREWLSDNVFMRIEAMYLIAAEASYRLGNDGDAITYLTTLTDQRIADGQEAEYAAHKATLSHDNLLAEIEYNWRVEMWGEGYGLQTFRRLAAEVLKENKRKRGANHCANPGADIDPTADVYTFQMPSSEGSYNPKVNTTPLP